MNDAGAFFASCVWAVAAIEEEGLMTTESADHLLLEKARGLAAAYGIDRALRARRRVVDDRIVVVS